MTVMNNVYSEAFDLALGECHHKLRLYVDAIVLSLFIIKNVMTVMQNVYRF